MNKYIGVKIIEAEPKTSVRTTKEGSDIVEGYKVRYENGYESWSPRTVFDISYRKVDNMSFGLAFEAAKRGYIVFRQAKKQEIRVITEQIFFDGEPTFRIFFGIPFGEDYKEYLPDNEDMFADDWTLKLEIVNLS